MPSARAGYSVVPVPAAFLPLRIIQLIFGLVVLGCAAYWISLAPAYDAGGLSLFTGIATLIFVVYWLIAASPNGTKVYNYWAIFAVEMFVLIMWLSTFALIAHYVAALTSFNNSFGNFGSSGSSSGSGTACYAGYCVNYKAKRAIATDPVSATTYTALALSVVNFILFAITFTLYTINIFKHRKNLAAEEAGTTPGRVEKGPAATEVPVYH